MIFEIPRVQRVLLCIWFPLTPPVLTLDLFKTTCYVVVLKCKVFEHFYWIFWISQRFVLKPVTITILDGVYFSPIGCVIPASGSLQPPVRVSRNLLDANLLCKKYCKIPGAPLATAASTLKYCWSTTRTSSPTGRRRTSPHTGMAMTSLMSCTGLGKRVDPRLRESPPGSLRPREASSRNLGPTLSPISVLSYPNFSLRGCLNPASRIPLAASVSFTQPLGEKYALQSSLASKLICSLLMNINHTARCKFKVAKPRACFVFRFLPELS